MKTIIGLLLFFIFRSTSQAQITFVNDISNTAICKFDIVDGKTTVYEEINDVCPEFKTWNQTPAMYVNDYSGRKYKMTVTATTSISKRTYYFEYRQLSGAGENKGKKNTGYVKLTIDYFEKNRKDKVIEANFTQTLN